MNDEKKCTINDLPKFSKWPARILGIEKWKQRVKSKDEIDREYELESWGAYLKRIKENGLEDTITSKDLDNWQCNTNTPILFSKREEFFQDTFGNVYPIYINIIEEYIKKFLPVKSIVELGCGYGSIILPLAERPGFNETKFLAAEYAPSGIELTTICARNQGIEIEVGQCDFMNEKITDLSIPVNSIIVTCASTCTLSKLPDSFVTSIKKYNPKVVIHFEPTYEHHNKNNLLDMLRRRYVEINDYNQNLLTLLKEHEQDNNIKILIEDPAVIGVNPLFPISVIAWKPVL